MDILYVEDDVTDLELTRQRLAHSAPRIGVDHAATLAEARARLRHPERYHLVLLDLGLPDGSGLELLDWIREQHLPLAVVVLTGAGDTDSAAGALQAGADDYLIKDEIEARELPGRLARALRRFRNAEARHGLRLRVLYAERNADDADLTARHLARHAPHIHLTLVGSAEEALDQLPSTTEDTSIFDVLLLDYRLPGLDALEALKQLRDDRDFALPVVIVSGQGGERVVARALQLGVDAYVLKQPGYLHQLTATLERIAHQAELARERAALRQTSTHLGLMLEASPVVLYTLGIDQHQIQPTWVSDNVTALLGFTRHQALHPAWWRGQLHPDDREQACRAMDQLVTLGQLRHQYRFFDHAGDVHWIEDELRVLRHDNEARTEVIGAWRDISDSKRAEHFRETRMTVLDGLLNERGLPELLGEIATRLEQVDHRLRVSVLVRAPLDTRLRTCAAPRLAPQFNAALDDCAPEQAPFATALHDAHPTLVADISTHPSWRSCLEQAQAAGLRACWSFPFHDDTGEALGILAVYRSTPGLPDAATQVHIAEFAQLAALAVTRARTANALRQSAAVLASAHEGVVITDLSPRILSINPAYTQITGYSAAEVIGRNPSLLRSERQGRAFYQQLWASLLEHGHWQGEIWNRTKSGEVRPVLLSISLVTDTAGNPERYVGVMTDLSQLRHSEAARERLAHFDPLTGLPNRLLLQSRLSHALERAQRHRHHIAVLLIDLDRFKHINNSLGHPAGDNLLERLAQRFATRLREGDTLGRLGGDEFLLVLERLHQPRQAASVARDLLELLRRPLTLPGNHEVHVGASIGIGVYPQDGCSASELIQHAEVALYQVKAQGRGSYGFHTPELSAQAAERLELEARLHHALGNEEFLLHFQPQLDCVSGALVGCEALVRWNTPDQGLIAPTRFIPLAEETGLILQLGDWVLHTACRQGMRWLDAGLVLETIAVNLSARQLLQPDCVGRIEQALSATGWPAHRLKLELTESMLMGGDETEQCLQALRALGIRLSIDDFGTGYSSLAYLRRFAIDELKIDRSFVRDIPAQRDDMEIAATIIAMARNLKLRVVAEGVETEAQLEFLRERGCEAYQGYLCAPPLTPEAFAARFGPR
ncbi:EAL domain-containing protein [Marichromatium gracile]|uniref:EAL domain-containing protein n=1 Tax=Marichromatium gracile TaxID=1048 RepID=UPI001F2FBD15|nr:EAL domain-containing protein [Marichromatium gracile]MCF1182712.1 EAL domain-containing protein [Marichromatium gracile]